MPSHILALPLPRACYHFSRLALPLPCLPPLLVPLPLPYNHRLAYLPLSCPACLLLCLLTAPATPACSSLIYTRRLHLSSLFWHFTPTTKHSCLPVCLQPFLFLPLTASTIFFLLHFVHRASSPHLYVPAACLLHATAPSSHHYRLLPAASLPAACFCAAQSVRRAGDRHQAAQHMRARAHGGGARARRCARAHRHHPSYHNHL